MTEILTPRLGKEELKKAFDISNFDLNALLRGVQLTLVGAHRALQNPNLFTSDHYRQAAIAVVSGIVIRILIALPVGPGAALLSLSPLPLSSPALLSSACSRSC